MAFNEYANYDGLGLAELVAKKQVSAAELVEEAITRIEKHNPKLNAVVFKTYDRARLAARAVQGNGPFAGVPFLLKDIMGVQKGVPTRQGSAFIPPTPSPHDATLTKRFTAAGLISLGKTNVPEFGLVPTTEPALYGPCRNPWNLEHSSGGSSGGSGAAVAAGIVPLAHANDGGGSIRAPASANGLVGLKPTRGRITLGPDLGDIMGGLVNEGVVSRTVRDTAALDAVAGNEPGDPYVAPPKAKSYLDECMTPPGKLRIGFATKNLYGQKLHPECIAAIEATAKLCQSLGHEVEKSSPALPIETLAGAFMPVWASGLAMLIDGVGFLTGRTPHENDFQGLTWGLYQVGKQVSAAQYQMCWFQLHAAARQVAAWHETYDIWLNTTFGSPPIRNGTFDFNEKNPEKGFAPIIDYLPFTAIQNATGQPAISLPLHWSAQGLPVGVHFVGRFGEEAMLLRLAGQLEKARPWAGKHPQNWN